ncbi:MAG: serine/threonine-protein kinase [Bacteroidota bacterium]
MSKPKGIHLNDYSYLPYQIITKVGEGGYGEVFQAQDRVTHATVALKTLHPNVTLHTPAHRVQSILLQHEYRVCQRVRNPHVVRSLHHGYTESGLPFSVFTFLAGETLQRRLQRLGPLPGPVVHQVMGQALQGLVAMHSQGLVHRDVKPANLMVDEHLGAFQLTHIDLGISAEVGSRVVPYGGQQPETLPQGSAHYSAPAQWAGQEAMPQHDWYAWALVVLECLLGYPVLGGLTPGQALRKKQEGIPLPTALVRHPLGEWLRDIWAGGNNWPNTQALLKDWQALELPEFLPARTRGSSSACAPTV